MQDSFTPFIDSKAFEKQILRIQDNEGNNPIVVNAITEQMKTQVGLNFYERFMNLCAEFQIKTRAISEKTEERISYRIAILKDGREYYSAELADATTDTTPELASKLYDVLAVQIKNDRFIKRASQGKQ